MCLNINKQVTMRNENIVPLSFVFMKTMIFVSRYKQLCKLTTKIRLRHFVRSSRSSLLLVKVYNQCLVLKLLNTSANVRRNPCVGYWGLIKPPSHYHNVTVLKFGIFYHKHLESDTVYRVFCQCRAFLVQQYLK